MTSPVKMFGCFCGCQSEGGDSAPACWGCGRQMHQWGERIPTHASTVLSGEAADTRTANGGYA
jgi:hypothetical protein